MASAIRSYTLIDVVQRLGPVDQLEQIGVGTPANVPDDGRLVGIVHLERVQERPLRLLGQRDRAAVPELPPTQAPLAPS